MEFNTLIEVTEYFADKESQKAYLKSMRWGNGPVICPKCQCDICYHLNGNWKRFKCYACRDHFTETTGSFLDSTSMPVLTWLKGVYIFANNNEISSVKLGKNLGITQKAAWRMRAIFLCAIEMHDKFGFRVPEQTIKTFSDDNANVFLRKLFSITMNEIVKWRIKKSKETIKKKMKWKRKRNRLLKMRTNAQAQKRTIPL